VTLRATMRVLGEKKRMVPLLASSSTIRSCMGKTIRSRAGGLRLVKPAVEREGLGARAGVSRAASTGADAGRRREMRDAFRAVRRARTPRSDERRRHNGRRPCSRSHERRRERATRLARRGRGASSGGSPAARCAGAYFHRARQPGLRARWRTHARSQFGERSHIPHRRAGHGPRRLDCRAAGRRCRSGGT
jgi:hypothetical protein